MQETIFKFRFAPTYHKTNINYMQANLINILRSLVVNKFRYLSRGYRHHQDMRQLRELKRTGDLEKITSLCRPGPLTFKI